MIYRIVQYIQPWEIDNFERQCDQLIRSSYYIKNSKNVVFDVTMNLNIVDWNNSQFPISYFENKFNFIKQKINDYFTAEFDTDPLINGCTDKRRSVTRKIQDYVIWLDSDLFFPVQLLPYMINATSMINDECYILTPEIIKYWDASWDCITNKRFLHESRDHWNHFDMYSVDSIIESEDIEIHKNDVIKFGGGWFNLFTNSVFDRIPIINELGAYGPDDTYVSYCGMKINIPQHLLRGIVVCELNGYLEKNKNYIKPFLNVSISDKSKISDGTLFELINKFKLT